MVDETPTEARTEPAGGTSPASPAPSTSSSSLLAPGIRVAYERPAADGAEDDSGSRGAVGASVPPPPPQQADVSLEDLMARMKSL